MGIVVSVIPDLIIGKSKLHGKGVFAGRHYNSGDTVLEFGGYLYDRDAIAGQKEFLFLQVGENLYLGPDEEPWGSLDDLINHGCDPNSAVIIGNGKVILKAIRPIKPMMEIIYDYSITMKDDPWTMSCRCGYVSCRKTISEYKTLPFEVRRSYEYMKIVPEYAIPSNGRAG